MADKKSAQEYVLEGEVLANEEMWEGAIQKYKEALKIDPTYREAYMAWGKAILKLEEPDEELTAYHNAVEADQKTADGFNDLANVYYGFKKYNEAIQCYKKALDIDDNHVHSYNNWGLCLQSLEKYQEAIGKYEQAIDIDSTYKLAFNNWGRCLAIQKKYKKAIEKYRQAIELDPFYELAYTNWGKVIPELDESEIEIELDLYSNAVESKLKTADGFNILGNVYYDLERCNEAIKYYKKAVDLNSNHKYAYFNWGLCLYKRGEYEGAIRKYKQAIEIDPSYELAYTNWGEAILKLDEFEKELRAYREAVETDLKTPDGFNDLGNLYYDLKRYEEAIEKYKRTIDLDPTFESAYTNWRRCIPKIDQPEKESEKFRKVVKANLPTPFGFTELALLYIDLQRYEEAIECCKKTLRIDPQHKFALINWGYALSLKNEYSKAIEKYKEAVEIDPTFEQAYTNWGDAIAKLDKPDEELEDYKKAVLNTLKTANGYNNLGNCFFSLKKYTEAIECYKKSSAADKSYIHAIYNWGLTLTRLGRYREAIEKYKEVISINPDNVDAYNNWGHALQQLQRYRESLDKFRTALEIDKNHLYANHNYAYSLESMGLFNRSRERWKVASDLYKKLIKEAQQVSDPSYYLYAGNINLHGLYNFEEAEKLYEQGLEIDPDNISILIDLVELYNMKDAINISDDKESVEQRREFHWKSSEYFKKAEQLLLEKLESEKEEKDSDTLFQIGWLYRIVENYQDAKKYLGEALEKLDKPSSISKTRILSEVGVVNVGLESYDDAIEYFKKALKREPENFMLQTNLAEAFLKTDMMDSAEAEYQKVLKVCPYYLDAVIGLGEVYSEMGDEAKKSNNEEDAEIFYNQALDQCSETLRLYQNERDHVNKKLNDTELSSIFYSRGYLRVKLYEVQNRVNPNLLTQAINDFKRVYRNTPQYYKAQRAIAKISTRLDNSQSVAAKAGAKFVFVCAIFLFLAAQFSFFIGTPSLGWNYYQLNEDALQELISEAQTDTTFLRLTSFIGKEYSSRQEYMADLSSVVGDNADAFLTISRAGLLDEIEGVRISSWSRLESVEYSLLTFGSLIFMVTGLYLREIRRLKFGAIELEKSSVEHFSTSKTFGISKG